MTSGQSGEYTHTSAKTVNITLTTKNGRNLAKDITEHWKGNSMRPEDHPEGYGRIWPVELIDACEDEIGHYPSDEELEVFEEKLDYARGIA